MKRWFARLWHWTERQARRPQAKGALFAVAFAEASVFPIPPDAMLVPMVVAEPRRAWRLAWICTLGSAIGALAGWWIGHALFDSIGLALLQLYGLQDAFAKAQAGFACYGAGLVVLAAISPLPFKAITIAAGALAMPWPELFIASLLARGARFFFVAGVLVLGGISLRGWLAQRAAMMTAAMAGAIALGFALLWAWR